MNRRSLNLLTNILVAVRMFLLIMDRICHFYTPEKFIWRDDHIIELPTSLSPVMILVVLIITLIIHAAALYGMKTDKQRYLCGVLLSSILSFYSSLGVFHKHSSDNKYCMIKAPCPAEVLGEEWADCYRIYIWNKIIRHLFVSTYMPLIGIGLVYKYKLRYDREHTMAARLLIQLDNYLVPGLEEHFQVKVK